MDKSIDGLTTPLGQLKEEVLVSTLKHLVYSRYIALIGGHELHG